MRGRGNNVAFANLERAFRRFSSAQSWSGRLNLQRYFEARYVDRMGKTHTDYFEADSFGEKQLPAPEGEGLFHQYRQAFENGTYIELSHASPALLIEKWRVNKRRT